MRRSRVVRITPALVLLLLLAACNDTTLVTVSKALHDYSVALNGIQNTVIAANAQGLMTTEETAPIVQLLFKLNEAGKRASALTRNLSTLPPDKANQLSSILNPVLQEVQGALSSGLFGIKNAQTRDNILGALTTAQVALSTITSLLPQPAPAPTGGK